MNEKKVYVVTAGYYSDYRIKAIFDSKEKADEYYIHSCDKETHEPEEWILNKEKANKGMKQFCMCSDYDNANFKASHIYSEKYEIEECSNLFYAHRSEYPKGKWEIEFWVKATNIEQATKIAIERLAIVKAEEHFRFPLLRQLCGFTGKDGHYNERYPMYDFHSRELILRKGETLTDYVLPAALDKSLKFKELDIPSYIL